MDHSLKTIGLELHHDELLVHIEKHFNFTAF